MENIIHTKILPFAPECVPLRKELYQLETCHKKLIRGIHIFLFIHL